MGEGDSQLKSNRHWRITESLVKDRFILGAGLLDSDRTAPDLPVKRGFDWVLVYVYLLRLGYKHRALLKMNHSVERLARRIRHKMNKAILGRRS